jgi:hypothetical protein
LLDRIFGNRGYLRGGNYMKRFVSILSALFLTVLFVQPAVAGPSRAIVQEMGSVIGDGVINVDLDWVSQTVSVASARDTTIGNGNATTGGITLSSVNIGLSENLELRLGRLPGLRSFITLPVGSGNNYGLTLKGAGFVPGLGIWGSYGSSALRDINSGSSDAGDIESSSWRVGGAYTIASSLVYNLSVDIGGDTAKAANVNSSGDVTTTAVAAAALYPLKENLLVGLELHYAVIDLDKNKAAGIDKVDALVPALGARATAGNWTIDAIAALVSTSLKPDASGTETATATVIGVPNVRINYQF